jgi:uncharacterized membrane protein
MSTTPSDPAETPRPSPEDIKANRAVAAAAYILFFLPLLAARESPFAMFHSNQGLVLLLTAIASNVVLGLIPFLGLLLVPLANLGILVLAVIGILNAVNGLTKPLPLIGGLTLLKPQA